MAKKATGRIALMSIHPQFADAILAGEKKVEFRKRPLADDVTHVLIYATAPVSAVVGVFAITGQTTASPSTLWRNFGAVAGIGRHGFFEYFGFRKLGTGIHVGSVRSPKRPMDLEKSLGISRPPQSFQYVPDSIAARAMTSMKPIEVGFAA